MRKRGLVAILLAALIIVGCGGKPPGQPAGQEPLPLPAQDKPGPAPGDAEPAAYRLSSLQMINQTTGWAMAERQGVLRTTDGGAHWSDVTPAPLPHATRDLVGAFLDAGRGWVAAWSEEGGPVQVFHTADGGETWHGTTIQQRGSGVIYGVSLDFIDAAHGWLLVEPEHGMSSSPGELFVTADGGQTWAAVARTDGSPGGLPFGGAIAFRDTATGWLVGAPVSTVPRHLVRTTDGGKTWREQDLPLPAGLGAGQLDFHTRPTFFAPAAETGVLAATFVPASYKAREYAAVVYVTQDGGDTWKYRSAQPMTWVAEFISAQTGWLWSAEPRDTGSTAPVHGRLYRTDDGGETRIASQPDPVLNASLRQGHDVVQLDFVTEQVGWALLGSPAGRLLKTEDGGENWVKVYPAATGTEQPGGDPASQPAAQPGPVLTQVDFNEVRQEAMPGNGAVHVVRGMAHIHATVQHATNLQWRLYPVSPGPADSSESLSILIPRQSDGKWVLDWNDPPPDPVRLTLYAEVEAGVPDAPSYVHEDGKRWAVLTSALVKGIDGGKGDGTGVLSTPPADRPALEEAVTAFYAFTARGDYAAALPYVHPTAFAPQSERVKAFFLGHQGQTGPDITEILGAQVWASWKFPWCMCRVAGVTEVIVRLNNGSKASVWALQDEQGRWRVLWDRDG